MIVLAPRDLGLVVREARRSKRMTQGSLAAKAGVSRDWLMALERGNRGAELGRVLNTLAALDLRISVTARPVQSQPVRRSVASLNEIIARAKKRM